MIQTLLSVFLILCVVGVILWGIGRIPGLPDIVKTVIYVLVAVFLLVWVYGKLQGGGGLHLSL